MLQVWLEERGGWGDGSVGVGAALGLERGEIFEGGAETAVHGGFVAEEGSGAGSREGVGEAAEDGIGVEGGVADRLGPAGIDEGVIVVATHGGLPGGLAGDVGVGRVSAVALMQMLGEGMALVQLQEGFHGELEAVAARGEDGKVLDQVFFQGIGRLEAGTEVFEVGVGAGSEDGVVGGVSAMGEGVATAGGFTFGGAWTSGAAGVEAVGGDLGGSGDHEGTSLLEERMFYLSMG
jgi:hypothetical protein